MPRAQFKITPGVDVEESMALNQTGVSSTNLIRFMPDRNGLGLVQKLGGWVKFYSTAFPSIVRRMWAWADNDEDTFLAVGCENVGAGPAELSVIASGSKKVITPTSSTSDIAPVATSTAGSPYVRITDANTTGVTGYDSVYIETQICI